VSEATVRAVEGEIRLCQTRQGTEHTVSFSIEDADVIIAWIRSAKAEVERRRPVCELVRRLAPRPGGPRAAGTALTER
jgi:hypothetical protein